MKRKTFTHSLKPLFLLLFVLLIGEVGWGQSSITAIGTAVTQNFDGLANSGTPAWTDNTTLTGWYARTDNTASISAYSVNDGTILSAGLFSFGSSDGIPGYNAKTERALGYVPSLSFTGASGVGNGYIGWRLKNNTSKTIGSIRIQWTGEQWRTEDVGTEQYLILRYQIGGTVTSLITGIYGLAGSQFASPIFGTGMGYELDGNDPSNRNATISVDINVNIAPGEEIMLRWEDIMDPSNNLMALDDVTFTALKEYQAITFAALPERPFVLNQTYTLTATTSSGLPVTYVSSDPAIISISGTTATIKAPGSATITASQPGNGTYAAAIDVPQIQVIAPAAPVATAATTLTTGGFTGNWNASPGGASEYWFSYSTDINFGTETTASAALNLFKVINNLLANTTYYYRIQAKFGTVYSAYSNTITVTTTSGVQTYNIAQSVNGFTSSTLTWSNGNMAFRILFLQEGTGSCPNPVDNTNYSANSLFGSGTNLSGSGFYCIYKGTASTVNLTNLYPGRTYTVKAFEFNQAAGANSAKFLTTVVGANNPQTFTTWGTTTFTNTTPGQSAAENWTTAARWDHATVPTAALHTAVLVYIDGNCEITSAAVANNLTIKASHSNIVPKLTINPDQSLTMNGTLTNSNGVLGLVLKSDATGTGSLMHNTDFVSATVQRFITGSRDLKRKKYHLVSVPINSTTYQSGVWLDSYLFTYLESTNGWKAWNDPTYNTLQTKEGAMIFYDANWASGSDSTKTYSITGELNNGEYLPTVDYSGSGKGFNLVPNPYPSAINWNAASGWTKTNISGTIWGFSPTAKNYGSWNGSTGTNSMTQYIPVGQGFFVEASGAVPVLTMNNSVRLNNNTDFLKSGEVSPNILHLIANGNDGQDEIAIQFAGDATNSSIDAYDAVKFYSDLVVPQLSSFTANDANLLSISGLPFGEESTFVPLRLDMDYTGDLTFTASGMESFQNAASIKLEDKQLTKLTDLRANPVYTFNHTPTDATDRFVLHFGSVLGIDKPEVDLQSTVTVSGNEIYLDYPTAANSNLMAAVYDIQGRMISQVQLNGTGQDKISIRTSGVYLVKLWLPSGVETHKIVVL